MKKNIEIATGKKKGIFLCALTALSIGVLSGCGSDGSASDSNVSSADSTTASSDTATDDAASGEVKKIKFGSGTLYDPLCFIDDDGNLAGFEFDMAREIDKVLPQYEIEMVGSDWEDLMTSVQLGKLDFISWQIKKTPEREEEFLFSDDWVTQQKFYLVVYADNDSIHSIADLQDATVNGCGPSEYTYKWWTEYIEEHPEQNINLISSDNYFDEAGIEALKNGSTTAVIDDFLSTKITDQRLGGNVLKRVGEPVVELDCYYMINKDETELKEAIDEAVKELKENGTYDALYQKWFGPYLD